MTPAAPLLVFVGPHASGKSTVGRSVAAALGWRFDPEIGERLRLDALAADPDAHAMRSQEEFDARVFAAEWERDLLARGPRVVETWHFGNLAYAAGRSPRVYDIGRALLTHLPHPGPVLVQPLRADTRTLLARLREPGPDAASLVRFFEEVGRRSERLAAASSATVLPPLHTDALTLEATVACVLERVGQSQRP